MPVERATVRGVSFLPNQSIVAAYNYIKDSKRFASLVRFDYSSKNQLWRFGMIRDLKNAKGVTCFCCDKENGMIIVAGADCSIRFMSLDLTVCVCLNIFIAILPSNMHARNCLKFISIAFQ